jgi:hypothetical protein
VDPEATSTSQRLDVGLLFASEYSVTEKTAVLPSGDSAGEETRWIFQRSSAVIGRFAVEAGAWARVGRAERAQATRSGSRSRVLRSLQARSKYIWYGAPAPTS